MECPLKIYISVPRLGTKCFYTFQLSLPLNTKKENPIAYFVCVGGGSYFAHIYVYILLHVGIIGTSDI